MPKPYSFSRYVHYGRWGSYWHQIDETMRLQPQNILIVGKGDGIVAEVLKEYVPELSTLDFDPALKPDIVASVEKIPLADGGFDVVVCCEVLEHLPFEKFAGNLAELARVSRRHVVLSLPHFGPRTQLFLKLPLLPEIRLAFKIPVPLRHLYNGEHYWEIGKRDYPVRRIRDALRPYFTITREFIPFDNQYHHFFILEKKA